MRTTKWTTSLLGGVAALALLTACGSTPEPVESPTDTSPETVQSTPPADGSPTTEAPTTDAPSEPAQSPADPAPQDGDLEAGFAAVDLAEADVPGSQVVGLDLDDGGQWEVEVVVDNVEHEFTISADGTQIVERDTDDADSDDIRKLGEVQVSLADAVRTAMADVDGGRFDQVDLDTHNGTVVWDVEIDTANDDVEIKVDVASGEIIHRD